MISKIFSVRSVVFCTIATTALLSGCADEFKSPDVETGEVLADVIAANENLDIYHAAATKTGLIAAYGNRNAGEFTIFAPSDDAFLAFMQTTFASAPPANETEAINLINQITTTSTPLNISTLVTRLNYHVLGSELLAEEITGTQTLTTLQGGKMSLSLVAPDVLINANTGTSGSKVILANAGTAINGVVHIIDKVLAVPSPAANILTPFGLGVNYTTNPVSFTGGSETGGDATGTDFDILAYALRKSGLLTTLLPNATLLPEFTIFAPNDNAMRAYLGDNAAGTAALENAAIQMLKSMDEATLQSLLKYHVISGRYLSTDLSDEKALTMLSGGTVTVNVEGAVVTLKDQNAATDPTVVTVNTLTNNGVVHTINGVLRPN